MVALFFKIVIADSLFLDDPSVTENPRSASVHSLKMQHIVVHVSVHVEINDTWIEKKL